VTSRRDLGLMFDFAGVLGLPQPASALEQMATLADMPVDLFESQYWNRRRAYDLGMSDGDYWRDVLASEPSKQVIDQLVRIDVESWLPLNDKVVQTARDYADEGAEIVVLSNAPDVIARRVEALPELGFVTKFYFSCDIEWAKPDRQAFELAKTERAHCVFVDDRPENVDAANAIGLDAVLFVNEADMRARLETLCRRTQDRYPRV